MSVSCSGVEATFELLELSSSMGSFNFRFLNIMTAAGPTIRMTAADTPPMIAGVFEALSVSAYTNIKDAITTFLYIQSAPNRQIT